MSYSARVLLDSVSPAGVRLTEEDDWKNRPCILGNSRQSRPVWKRAYGNPGSLWVLHRCNQITCRELTHLYLGTPSQNTLDSYRAGRIFPSQQPGIGQKISETRRRLKLWVGKQHRAESRQKISAALKGRPKSPEHREKIRQALLRRSNRGV